MRLTFRAFQRLHPLQFSGREIADHDHEPIEEPSRGHLNEETGVQSGKTCGGLHQEHQGENDLSFLPFV